MTTLVSDTDVPASPVSVMGIERLKWVGPIAAYIPCVTLLPKLTAVKGTSPSASDTTT